MQAIVCLTLIPFVLNSGWIPGTVEGAGDQDLVALVNQQAATIQSLEARLDAQENNVKQLETKLGTQASQIQIQTTMLQILQTKVAAHEKTISQCQTSLQDMETRLGGQSSSVNCTSLEQRIEKQEQAAAFHAHIGPPYGPYHYTKNDPIVFNNALVNIGDGYDTTTGVFTAPFNGIYVLGVQVLGTHPHNGQGIVSGNLEVGIYSTASNRFECIAFAEEATHDLNDQGSCTAVMHLQKGDQVYVKYEEFDQWIQGSTLSSFTGFLIQSL